MPSRNHLRILPNFKSFFLLVAILFCVNVPLPIQAVAATVDSADSSESNGQIEYPERMKSRETWEWILSAPGLIVNLPFAIGLKIVETGVGTIYQPSVVGWLYDITTSDDSLRAIRPAYSSPSGFGFKIYQKDLFNEGSYFQLSAKRGFDHRQKYQLKYDNVSILGGKFFTSGDIGYRILHDEHFFGIGPETEKDDRTYYAYEYGWAKLGLGYGEINAFRVFSQLSFDVNNVLGKEDADNRETIDVYSEDQLPELKNGVQIWGYDINAEYDTRDVIGGPRRGWLLKLSGGIFNQLDDDTFSFWKSSLDIRKYVHLFYGRVLRLRIAGEFSEPTGSDKRIPFYYLSHIGPIETIRGFERGRFLDYDMVMGSLEYRWPIWRRLENTLDAFLFVDSGQVAHNIIDDFDFDDLQFGYGGGFRFWNDESESLNLVFGFSKEKFRAYLGVNR